MSKQNHILHFHISKKRKISWLDKAAVVAALIYPITGLPQIVEVFNGNIDGVSLLTWAGYIVFGLFFLTYGLVHKITPMIITNVLWLFVDSLVVGGLLFHSVLI